MRGVSERAVPLHRIHRPGGGTSGGRRRLRMAGASNPRCQRLFGSDQHVDLPRLRHARPAEGRLQFTQLAQ
jgi:hypothetical protein